MASKDALGAITSLPTRHGGAPLAGGTAGRQLFDLVNRRNADPIYPAVE